MNDIVHIVDDFEDPTAATLPIFRSEAQFRVLGELYTSSGLALTIGELAGRIAVPRPTVSREVKRLAAAGLLLTEARGRQTVVTADTRSPLYADLRNLLSKVYGVVPVLRREFAGVAERIVVFGSWAARRRGEPGPQPRDIDVLVVTDAPADMAWDAAARASRRLGMEVNVVVRTPESWTADDSGFAREIETRPSVVVDLPSAPVVGQMPRTRTSSPSEERYG